MDHVFCMTDFLRLSRWSDWWIDRIYLSSSTGGRTWPSPIFFFQALHCSTLSTQISWPSRKCRRPSRRQIYLTNMIFNAKTQDR